MTAHPLDNPVWSSLTTVHREFASGTGTVLRYPADVAPFVAISEREPIAREALESLVTAGEVAYMLGPRPELPSGWARADHGVILQMVCDRPIEVPSGPPVTLLTRTARPAVLELASLVYPHYFRPRSTELGRYHGVLEDDWLGAMIGERMAMPGAREISAVCTHPMRVGRGLARRLLAVASNDLLARGETPFLHVSPTNERARRLYEQNGYRQRADIAFWSIARA